LRSFGMAAFPFQASVGQDLAGPSPGGSAGLDSQ